MSGPGSTNNVEIRITGNLDPSVEASTTAAAVQIEALGTATNNAAKKAVPNYQAIINATTGVEKASLSAKESLFGMAMAAQEASKMKAAAAALTDTEAAAKSFTPSMSTATRETRALFDELSSGRTRMVPGTLAIIAQRVFGLSAASLLAVGGVLALAGGLAYLVYQELEAQKNLDHLTEGFALSGRGATMNAEAVKTNLDFLSRLPGSTSAAANGFLHLAAEHANWTSELTNSVGQLLPAFVDMYGKEAPQAAAKLMESLSNLTEEGFQKLDREMLGLNPTQYETIQNLIKTGDTAKAVSLILADLSKNSGIYIKSLGDRVYDTEQAIMRLKATMNDAELAGHGDTVDMQRLKALQATLAEIRREESQQGQKQKDNKYKDEMDDINKSNKSLDERATIMARIATLTHETADAKARGDHGTEATGNQDIAGEQKKLADLDKKQGDQSFRIFQETEQAKADLLKSGSAQRIAIEQTVVDRAKQQFGEESTEYLQALGRMNTEKRQNAAQAAEADKEAARKSAEAAKETARQQDEIARDNLNTDLEISKMRIAAKKQELEEEVAAGAITNAQRLAQLRELVAAEDAADIERLNKAAENGNMTSVEFDKNTNDIRKAWEKLQLDLASIDRQIADDQKKTGQQSAKAWEDANKEIISSEDGLVRNLLTKRQGLEQDLYQMLIQMLEKEIEADLNYWTERALLSMEGVNIQTATEKGGVLQRLLMGQQEVAQTTATEAAKTGAVVAGTTARTTTEQAARTAGSAAEVASGSASIMNAAYEAAAHTYASISAIPIVGPILAIPAAAAAFAGVMAFDTLTSFDVGTNMVPRDMVAQIHQGERIIPAADNRALMNAVGGGRGSGDVHLHYTPTVNPGNKPLNEQLEEHGAAMMDFLRSAHRDGKFG